MSQLVSFDFNSHNIAFTQDAFVNLTEMCAAFKKRPVDFLKLDSTQRFLVALAADTGLSVDSKCEESSHLNQLLVTQRGQHGGGTWAHPDLALECARWLSPEFAIWTNRTIRKLLSGECLHNAQDFRALARLECKLKELNAEAALLRRRMGRMTHVEGNVSVWPYLRAAGLELPRTTCARVALAASRLCAAEGVVVGTVRQRCKLGSTNHWNTMRTFPPSMLCRVLLSLGFKHSQPALASIQTAWRPMLSPNALT